MTTNPTPGSTTTREHDELLRGPERFAAPAADSDRPGLGKVVGSGLILLLLLVGIPALLWLLTGPPPIPTGLPSRDDLTQPLDVDGLLVVLRVVVWLAWLQFAVCTVVETVSLVRGGGLPRPVPLSGRSQALARALVGTFLIGTSFLGSAGAAQAVTATPATTPAATSAAVAHGAGAQAAGAEATATPSADAVAHAPEAAETPRMQHVPGVPASMTDVIGHKVAIVQPPKGHYHDNLWDIAERHLGDGRRWREIFELNKGRDQPDGGHLVLGRLIQPGWVLVMPDDATGVARVHAAPEQAPPARDTGADDGAAHAGGAAQGGAQGDVAAHDGGIVEDSSSATATLLGGGLFAGVVLVGLLAERRRRRSAAASDAELETEVALRIGADEDRVAWLDRALRGLSAACRAERIALPQVYAASVSADAVELRIAPPAMTAPAPWSVLEDGARWRLERHAEVHGELGHAPYPGLVCLGRADDGADVLVDLEGVGGIVSVSGSDQVAHEVVSALAVQLATAPWADEQVVRGYHLASSIVALGGGPVELVDDLDALVAEWGSAGLGRDAREVLTGRLGRHPGVGPSYLLLGSRPADEETVERLAGLTAAGARGLGVVAATELPGARWRIRVDDHGRLSLPLLDVEVDAVRLGDAAAEHLVGLFEKARRPEQLDVTARVPVPPAPRPGDDMTWRTAEVRIGVLGPIEVRAQRELDPARLALATELVVFLALQPGPVHPSVVGASLWPRGVTAEVRDATIARVRDWLGKDAEGGYLLRETADGRLHLADDVAVDWSALCTLVQRARESAPPAERDLLRRALQLVRSELLEGRPALRYAWLPRTRLEQVSADVVVDAAHRLAELSRGDDPSGAAAACRAGLRLAPTAQLLWRDLLTIESENPDGPGAAAAVEEMLVELHEVGAPLDAETEALVAELLPAHEGDASA